MARTDGILSTGVSIDSAIVGITAMVFVNGSAYVCKISRDLYIIVTMGMNKRSKCKKKLTLYYC